METLFALLLVVREQHGIELRDVFDHKLSPVAALLIEEFVCLREDDKSLLVSRMG